uniref:hypothetical protein n=1 Tax=Bacillaceae bacterium JMAK1 TaxID=1028381 RepID=UPI0003ABFEF2|nr:hypothetical protein [Bacillaceae bacterium JMAK1]AGQ45432.1 hypothetical protein [Bacillaceae bacterium JMAK1]
MFEELLTEELATRIGTRVEITTSINLFSGILIRVTADFIVVLPDDGYGTSNQQNISVNAINYVRFPVGA